MEDFHICVIFEHLRYLGYLTPSACPVLCLISCSTIGRGVMGVRQSAGEQDRGGRCIIHSASHSRMFQTSRSHVRRSLS